MTQPSQQDVQLSTHLVTAHIASIAGRDEALLDTFKACRESVVEAAQLYADEKDQEKLGGLQAQLLGIIEAERQAAAHKAALAQLEGEYAPRADAPTDFAAALERRMATARAQLDGPPPERDEDALELRRIAGDAGLLTSEAAAAAAAAAGAGDELGSDEELAVVDGHVEKNERCPYTLKDLLELREPVEDAVGFVYEAAAVRAAIAQQGRLGWVEAPFAGASHRVALADLKPCRRVARQQQRLARRGGGGGAGGAGGAGGGAGGSGMQRAGGGGGGGGAGGTQRVLDV